MIDAPVRRVRRGHELRLIVAGDDQPAIAPAKRDEKLVALLAEPHQARALMLASPDKPIQRIAADAERCRKRLPKLVRMKFLAPDIVRAIMSGVDIADVTPASLMEMDLPLDWKCQRELLGLA